MNIQAFLLDIDGTLMIGNEPIPGASEVITFLIKEKIPHRFVSNGSRKSMNSVIKKLRLLNTGISDHDIYTPALAAFHYLSEKKIKTCNLLVTSELMDDFARAGINHDPEASTVVVGDAAENFTYEHMNSAFRSLMNDGELIALEKDRYWKDVDGLSLSAGPFVTALEFASGKTAVIMGKPSLNFFRYALSDLQMSPKQVAMIGDDIMTDVNGAQIAGMTGIITLTGKFKPGETDTCEVTPDHYINSIAELPELCGMQTPSNK
ncbi:MAG: TIGR01458 family HAD-type hydrolase [Methanomicrobiales archaeon]|nr:TIGR01458 family HAD-type hydrolase [Methanomicrobiales archaeon]